MWIMYNCIECDNKEISLSKKFLSLTVFEMDNLIGT